MKERLREDGGRQSSEALDMPEPPDAGKGKEFSSPLEPPEGAQSH